MECKCQTDGFTICEVDLSLKENMINNLEVWNRREVNERRRGRLEKIDKNLVLQLGSEGISYFEIAKRVNCSKTYIIKLCK